MSGPATFSRVMLSGVLMSTPREYTGEDGQVSHVTLELGTGDQNTIRVYCTAFKQTAVHVTAAGLEPGDHVLVNGRLRSSTSGDRSNWVEVQEIGLGVRSLGEDDAT